MALCAWDLHAWEEVFMHRRAVHAFEGLHAWGCACIWGARMGAACWGGGLEYTERL